MAREKEYTNGELTIVWKPNLCVHAKHCIQGLPGVFDYEARPWINAEGATTQAILEQVKKCPSGALSTYMNADGKPGDRVPSGTPEVLIKVVPNGPILLSGPVQLTLQDGHEEKVDKQQAFCRCGASNRKPYCDGSHNRIQFQG